MIRCKGPGILPSKPHGEQPRYSSTEPPTPWNGTKDVAAFAVVGGNPAELIRYRFDEDTRRVLTDIVWWDWDAAKVTRNVRAICSGDLEALKSAA